MATQQPLDFSTHQNPSTLVQGLKPDYTTPYGAAYLGDSRDMLKALPDSSVNLVFTSPPYALHFKKEYGNVSKNEYVEWFCTFACEIFRVLTDDGSFVLNIGGSYNKGIPTRSTYHFKTLLALTDELNFHLAQEFFWYNPAKMPMPAEWVTVRRIRVKDSVEYVWWFSKTPHPKANNRHVLREYSADMIRLNKRGVRATVRPSGHNITSDFDKVNAGGSIPPNVSEDEQLGYVRDELFDDAMLAASDWIRAGNNAANDQYTLRCKEAGLKIHPARFPAALPEFFVKLCTEPGDVVVDPFGGSNTAGAVAERLGRRWLIGETVPEYLAASRFRFDSITG